MQNKLAVFAVYSPPSPGLPFLAVMIDKDGDVTATAHNTASDAQHHADAYAARLQQIVDTDDA